MITLEERSIRFLEELKILLQKHNVELVAKDYWQGYPECGEDVRITAEFNSEYFDGDLLKEGGDFNLTNWVRGGTDI